jgi:hypothetical protein
MATLTELTETIAAVEGLERSTVSLVARYLREAGLIATGGRGTSAATMSLTDAANLLIGVNTVTTAVEAAKAVSAYRGLEASETQLFYPDMMPPQKYGTFGEAIEQLIHATGVGALPERFLNRGVPDELQEAFARGEVRIALSFRKSHLSASLTVDQLPEGHVLTSAMAEEVVARMRGWNLRFSFYPPRLRGPPTEKKEQTGDRIEETTIGYPTLNAVGKLVLPRG